MDVEPETGPAGSPDGRDRFLPVASWAMYDFANTIYSGIVITFIFPLYITYELGMPKTFLGLATMLSFIASGFIAPYLGCIPDRTGRTKRYLIIVTLLCCLSTFALSGVSLPLLLLGIYFFANVMYQTAMVFYNALLPVVASPGRQGMVSGWGVALGYVGVILALLVAMQLSAYHESGDPHDQLAKWDLQGLTTENSRGDRLFGILDREGDGPDARTTLNFYKDPARKPEQRVATALSEPGAAPPFSLEIRPVGESGVTGTVAVERFEARDDALEVGVTKRWIFIAAASLFLIFSLPLVFFVPERTVSDPQRFSFALASQGLRTISRTIKTLPGNRNLLLFLVGNLLCVDVLNTAIGFFSVYFTEVFAFSQTWIYMLGAGMSGAAFAGGILMGFLTDRAGAKRAMIIAALLLIGAIATVGVVPVAWVAVAAITVMGALGLAGLWVAGRKLLIELAPPERIGEYFGLYGITIKISVVGTLVFGLLVDLLPPGGHWNFRIAILVQLILIIPGVLLLWRVRPIPQSPEGGPARGEPRPCSSP